MARKTPSPSQKTGQQAEEIAAQWLSEHHGYQILYKNYRCRRGEIDLIAQLGEAIAFIEVRSLKNQSTQAALATIGPHKQKRLFAAAQHYLAHHIENTSCPPIQFDFLGINFNHHGEIECELWPNALSSF